MFVNLSIQLPPSPTKKTISGPKKLNLRLNSLGFGEIGEDGNPKAQHSVPYVLGVLRRVTVGTSFLTISQKCWVDLG